MSTSSTSDPDLYELVSNLNAIATKIGHQVTHCLWPHWDLLIKTYIQEREWPPNKSNQIKYAVTVGSGSNRVCIIPKVHTALLKSYSMACLKSSAGVKGPRGGFQMVQKSF